MSSRIELERVVLGKDENVDKPLDSRGNSPGMDRVFERNPKQGRWGCNIWLDAELMPWVVIIQDPVSGEEHCIPSSRVEYYRTLESREQAKKHRAAKAKEAPAPIKLAGGR